MPTTTTVGFGAASYTAVEQPHATTYAIIAVELNAATAQTVTVNVSTGQGSAKPGTDYTPVAVTATFAPGQTTQDVTVPILGDPQADGTVTVPLTLSSPTGATLGANTGTILYLEDGSQAPVAQNQNYSVAADGTLSVPAPGLLANAGDSSGQPLSVSSVNGKPVTFGAPITLPSGATLTIQASGAFSYVPRAGFTGSDGFSFTLTDGISTSNTATVMIGVMSMPPVAQNQNFSVAADGTLSVPAPGLLTNASDPSGQPLTVASINGHAVTFGAPITLPSGATLTVASDSSFKYVPRAGYVGSDGFSFTLTDGISTSNQATAAIGVMTTPPVAQNQNFNVAADGTLNVPAPGLLTNASDPSGQPLSVSSVNGHAVTFGAPITLPSGATLTVQASGALSYVPRAGYVGSDGFSFTLTDGISTSNTAGAMIGVTSTPPVAQNQSFSVVQNGTLSVPAPGLLAGASDPSGQPLSVATVNGNPVTFGAPITLPSGATLTVASDSSFKYVPRAGYVGSDGFSFTLTDGISTSNTAGAMVSVTSAAPVAQNQSFSVVQNGTLSVSAPGLLTNASDPSGKPLTVATINGNPVTFGAPITLPSGATLTVGSDSSFSYVAPEGFTGSDGFSFTLTDGTSTSNTAGAMVSVTSAPPVAQDQSFSVMQNGTLSAAAPGLLANASDPSGLPLTVASVNGKPVTFGSPITLPSGATLIVASDGSLSYAAPAGYVGSDGFTFTLTDGTSTSNTADAMVSVISPVPVAQDQSFSVVQNGTLSAAAPGLLGNTSDPSGLPLTVASINGNPVTPGAPITLPSGATLTVGADNSVSYVAPAGYVGSDGFSFTLSDGTYTSNTATAAISVTSAAPVAQDLDFSVVQNGTLSVAAPGLLANASDPNGQTLTVSSINGSPLTAGVPITLPSGATLTVQPNGTLNYAPPAGYVGSDGFTFTLTDGTYTSNTATASISVTNVGPVAQNQSFSVAHDSPLVSSAPGLLTNATDTGGQALTVAAINGNAVTFDTPLTLPSGATLTVESDGSFYYAPSPGFVGNDSFTFTLSDGTNVSSPATASIAVMDVAPVANAVGPFTTLPGTPLPINVLANAYAPEGGSLNPVIVQAPKNGTLTIGTDGLLTYQPNAGFTGQDGFTYQVTDGILSSSPVNVQLTVAAQPLVANPVYMQLAPGGTAVFTDQDLLAYDQGGSGSPLAITGFTLPANGKLTRDANGNWSYTPNAGWSGADQATYTVSNGGGQTATATLTFQVVPGNPFGVPAAPTPYVGTFLSNPTNPAEIASISSTNAIHVWTGTNPILGSPFFITGATRVFPAAAFNPNPTNNANINQLAVAYRTTTGLQLGVLDLNNRRLVSSVTLPPLPGTNTRPQSVNSVSYSPNGTQLLVGTNLGVLIFAVNADGSLGAQQFNIPVLGLMSASLLAANTFQAVQPTRVTISTLLQNQTNFVPNPGQTVTAPAGQTIVATSGSIFNGGTLAFATQVGTQNNNFPVYVMTGAGTPRNAIFTRVTPVTAVAVAGNTLELGFQGGAVLFYNIGGTGAPVQITRVATIGHHAYSIETSGTGETAVSAVALNAAGTVGYSSSLDGSLRVWLLNTQTNTVSRSTPLR